MIWQLHPKLDCSYACVSYSDTLSSTLCGKTATHVSYNQYYDIGYPMCDYHSFFAKPYVVTMDESIIIEALQS